MEKDDDRDGNDDHEEGENKGSYNHNHLQEGSTSYSEPWSQTT